MEIQNSQIILATLPLISWLLQYVLSNSQKQLHVFRKHYATYYLDLIFIPFNFLWIYSVKFNFHYYLLLFIICAILFYFTSMYWLSLHRSQNRPSHLFDLKTGKLSGAGFAHAIFALIEFPLILNFILSPTNNFFAYLNSIFLIIFFVGSMKASIKIHGTIHQSDISFSTIGILIILIKLILFI